MENKNLFIKKTLKENVLKIGDIQYDKISFGNFWKKQDEIFVPILLDNKQCCVQLSNLLSLDVTLEKLNYKLVGTMKRESNVFEFLSKFNAIIEDNLKRIIKRIKTLFILEKKFNYDACYKYNDDICFIECNFTPDDINNKVKLFNSNKQVVSFDILSKLKEQNTEFLFSLIVTPTLKINIVTGDIYFYLSIHQIKINDNTKNDITLENYSFIESDDEENINIETATETYVTKCNRTVDFSLKENQLDKIILSELPLNNKEHTQCVSINDINNTQDHVVVMNNKQIILQNINTPDSNYYDEFDQCVTNVSDIYKLSDLDLFVSLNKSNHAKEKNTIYENNKSDNESDNEADNKSDNESDNEADNKSDNKSNNKSNNK